MNQVKIDKLCNVLYEHLSDIGGSVCDAQSDNFGNRCNICPMSVGAFHDRCNITLAKQMLFDIQIEISRQITKIMEDKND